VCLLSVTMSNDRPTSSSAAGGGTCAEGGHVPYEGFALCQERDAYQKRYTCWEGHTLEGCTPGQGYVIGEGCVLGKGCMLGEGCALGRDMPEEGCMLGKEQWRDAY
jgi:hypothetical protein